jgi:hypothetical protein
MIDKEEETARRDYLKEFFQDFYNLINTKPDKNDEDEKFLHNISKLSLMYRDDNDSLT